MLKGWSISCPQDKPEDVRILYISVESRIVPEKPNSSKDECMDS